jgi:hypothetical protein
LHRTAAATGAAGVALHPPDVSGAAGVTVHSPVVCGATSGRAGTGVGLAAAVPDAPKAAAVFILARDAPTVLPPQYKQIAFPPFTGEAQRVQLISVHLPFFYFMV